MECLHISECLDLLHTEVLHHVVMVVHHHPEWLTWIKEKFYY